MKTPNDDYHTPNLLPSNQKNGDYCLQKVDELIDDDVVAGTVQWVGIDMCVRPHPRQRMWVGGWHVCETSVPRDHGVD